MTGISSEVHAKPDNHTVLEKIENGLAIVTLNRPEKLNAINNELATAFNKTMLQLSQNESVHVVIITGAGRAFCAGGDLEVIRKGREAGDSKELEPMLRGGMQAVLKIRTMPQPVIAAVNGAAAGAGMNIALAADIRIAAEEAVFGQNFVKVGLFPDYGGTYFLPELVGPAKAAELFYTGEMIDARKALELGIVNKVVPAAQLEAEVMAFAKRLLQGPPLSLRAIKKHLFASKTAEIAHALEQEVHEQLRAFNSEDSLEGMKAFFEKRPPRFQGK
jgi:2-(1,2-epoxy-1,2-dihydrophenyl)acetyl-CoA isomerase